jgi:signal transduction histidine kinase
MIMAGKQKSMDDLWRLWSYRMLAALVMATAAVILHDLLYLPLLRLLHLNQWPTPIAVLIGIFLLALILLAFSPLIPLLLRSRVMRKHVPSRNIAPELRDQIAQCRDTTDLAERLLTIVQREFNVEDVQLTFYYDQPFALEVTHLRRTGEHMQRVIARVREDEPDAQSEEEDVLTPLSAAHTEVLTHRDRLVGLLLLGRPQRARGFAEADIERLESISPVIAAGADQVMMIRHINETNQRMFESDKLISIGQLASGIAHEIRNPLSSIKMNLQGLKRRASLSQKDQQRVQISLDEITRLDDIIREIMQFARRTKLEVHPVSGNEFIMTAVETVRSEVEQRGIELQIEIDGNLPVIRADSNRLIRVLINLIMNAAQAMGHGGRITLQAEPYGTGIEVQVTDQGPGIPKDLHRDIFNPFFTTKAEGTGLGLANALKFVQEHGGELDFVTEVDVGTTFSMRLPPHPPSHLDDPAALRVVPT